jgi:hypothetical protein
MSISWVEVHRSLRRTSVAEREDAEAVTETSSAVAAVVQFLFSAANTHSVDYRIYSELDRMASQAEGYIPPHSSDGVLVFVTISTATDGSTSISTSTFECANFVGPPYNFSDTSHAFHHFRGQGSFLPAGPQVSSTRYFWGTRG